MPAYLALWVSEQALKSYTSIHSSVSPTDLAPFVRQAQDLYLQGYLGSTFYNQLNAQIINDNVSAVNRTILDNYLAPALCNLAMHDALPFLSYKIFNKSILRPGSESASNIDLQELKFLQAEVKSVAENYIKLLQLYLKNNISLYPAYGQYLLADGLAPNKKTPYFSGIQTNSKYFNRNRRKNIRNATYYNGTNDMDPCFECDPIK